MSGSPTLRERLFVATQYALPQHFLSGLVYRLTRSRSPWLKNLLISNFMRGFAPDMSDAVQPDPLAYGSFNEFFTRALRPDARPQSEDEQVLVSPVDGAVSQLGLLEDGQILQAKGRHYSLQDLLADPDGRWAPRFTGGAFATLYLAPFNYHRIHMPMPGRLVAAWYVPGRLFSVNAVTAAAVPRLFARNDRVVCLFENGPLLFGMVLVGALFVGSMDTVWHGQVTPCSPRRYQGLALTTQNSPLQLPKGAEMGRFNMGSTVILLLPPGAVDWLPALQPRGPVVVGQPLARLRAPAGTHG